MASIFFCAFKLFVEVQTNYVCVQTNALCAPSDGNTSSLIFILECCISLILVDHYSCHTYYIWSTQDLDCIRALRYEYKCSNTRKKNDTSIGKYVLRLPPHLADTAVYSYFFPCFYVHYERQTTGAMLCTLELLVTVWSQCTININRTSHIVCKICLEAHCSIIQTIIFISLININIMIVVE